LPRSRDRQITLIRSVGLTKPCFVGVSSIDETDSGHLACLEWGEAVTQAPIHGAATEADADDEYGMEGGELKMASKLDRVTRGDEGDEPWEA
jgi:hypothetical protein